MESYSTAPIQLRAKITPQEWEALRILALRLNRTTSDLVAEALRATYPTLTNGDTHDGH